MRKPVHPIVAQLREERIRQNLSLKAMEERTGYTNQHIWQIEVGKHGVRIDVVSALAHALGFSLVLEKRDGDEDKY